MDGEFEDGNPVLPGDGADVFGGQAIDLQDAGLPDVGRDGDVGAEDEVPEPGRVRAPDGDGMVRGRG